MTFPAYAPRRPGLRDRVRDAPSRSPKRPNPRRRAPAAPQPIKLDLIPLQAPWTKVCQKDPAGAKEFCRTIRAFGQAVDQPPTLPMAVDTLTGEDKKIVRMQLPEGLLLRPGFRLVLEKGDPDRRPLLDLRRRLLLRRGGAQRTLSSTC